MQFLSLILTAALSLRALAAPVLLEGRDSTVTPLNAASISSYSFYANFVAAAYCSGTVDWSCSELPQVSLSVYASRLNEFNSTEACKLIPGFVPYATGGDGGKIPLCMLTFLIPCLFAHRFLGFVGWWPALSTVVVSHEGTDPTQL